MSLGSHVSLLQQCSADVSKISKRNQKIKKKLEQFNKISKFPKNLQIFSKFLQISPNISKDH